MYNTTSILSTFDFHFITIFLRNKPNTKLFPTNTEVEHANTTGNGLPIPFDLQHRHQYIIIVCWYSAVVPVNEVLTLTRCSILSPPRET